jgi:hypothetical protein
MERLYLSSPIQYSRLHSLCTHKLEWTHEHDNYSISQLHFYSVDIPHKCNLYQLKSIFDLEWLSCGFALYLLLSCAMEIEII